MLNVMFKGVCVKAKDIMGECFFNSKNVTVFDETAKPETSIITGQAVLVFYETACIVKKHLTVSSVPVSVFLLILQYLQSPNIVDLLK